MSLRETFEIWARGLGHEVTREPNGGRYITEATRLHWLGWAASSASAEWDTEPSAWTRVVGGPADMHPREVFVSGPHAPTEEGWIPLYRHVSPAAAPEASAPSALAVLRALMTNPHISLEDQVYQIREREGQEWDGPSVKAWSDAVVAATELLKHS